jgi:MFS family permease
MVPNGRAYVVAPHRVALLRAGICNDPHRRHVAQLEQAFSQSRVGVGNILGSYYYTYSLTSLVAGLALDRLGAKYVIPFGSFVLGMGCLLFVVENPQVATIARLLQGAGSAFAFTCAVYLAVHGFSARSLATVIGITQSLGMLGGSAGQFIVGPFIQSGVDWSAIWLAIGVAGLVITVALLMITPTSDRAPRGLRPDSLLTPYWIVLRNKQSYLSGLIAGLLFAPTTIGALTWGVALQNDQNFTYRDAALIASLVPLGWAFGCPLMGWLADRIGLRKPVLLGGALIMAITLRSCLLLPRGSSLDRTPRPASGVAMIPIQSSRRQTPTT